MPIFHVAFSSREMLVKRKILFLLIVVRRINFPYLDTNFSLLRIQLEFDSSANLVNDEFV
ncbi:hypothetical protein ccbrp13_16270 [Ktedonobacteria bacterium brp13]|nr:hypothetical protein ccbrp13_16270 [Ktedonobacteria bacterium brp13]